MEQKIDGVVVRVFIFFEERERKRRNMTDGDKILLGNDSGVDFWALPVDFSLFVFMVGFEVRSRPRGTER